MVNTTEFFSGDPIQMLLSCCLWHLLTATKNLQATNKCIQKSIPF